MTAATLPARRPDILEVFDAVACTMVSRGFLVETERIRLLDSGYLLTTGLRETARRDQVSYYVTASSDVSNMYLPYVRRQIPSWSTLHGVKRVTRSSSRSTSYVTS